VRAEATEEGEAFRRRHSRELAGANTEKLAVVGFDGTAAQALAARLNVVKAGRSC
jgi:hypothetical protein